MQLTTELWYHRAFEVTLAAILCCLRNRGKHNFAWLAVESTQNRQEGSNTFYLSPVGNRVVLYFSNGVFLAAGQKGKKLDMQIKYLLIQIYVVFPHQRNFINMNYLKPDGITKSKGILCGLHRNVTRLSREMSIPLSSPPETKAVVYRGMHWGGEYHFQW